MSSHSGIISQLNAFYQRMAPPSVRRVARGLRRLLGYLTRHPQPLTPKATPRSIAGQDTRGDREQLERRRHVAIRFAMSEDACSLRKTANLTTFAIGDELVSRPRVTAVVPTCRMEQIEHVMRSFCQQNYENKELIVAFNNIENLDLPVIRERYAAAHPAVIWLDLGAVSLGEALNQAIARASGDYVAKMDDDDYYFPNYLSDLVLATRFTDASVLGKTSVYTWMEDDASLYVRRPGHEFSYGRNVAGGTLFFKRSLFPELRFSDRTGGGDVEFLHLCLARGHRILSIDRFNYVQVRRRDTSIHTWKISKDEYLANAYPVGNGFDPSYASI